MTNLFLTDGSLQGLIEATKLASDEKAFLLAKVPQLDEEERQKMFDFLKEICFIDRAEVKAVEKIRRNWK